MEVIDRIHGRVEIDTPVLVELIQSKPVQRLQRIHQYGVPNKYYHLKGGTRFGHSVGTMLLLKNLGASVEEQAAGLLHDVSHTAFSHIYDWVVADKHSKPGSQEDLQDQNHHKFFFNSMLPEILLKHGLDPKRVADHHNFGLLEQPTPALCADRVDYSLMEVRRESRKMVLPYFTTWNNQIVMTEHARAAMMGRLFVVLQMNHWGGTEAVRRYHHLSQALRFALENGDIKHQDFYLDDFAVIAKVEASKDPRVNKQLEILKQDYIPKPKGEFTTVYKKFRYVDPIYPVSEFEASYKGLEVGRMIRISETNSQFRSLLYEAREQNSKGVQVAID